MDGPSRMGTTRSQAWGTTPRSSATTVWASAKARVSGNHLSLVSISVADKDPLVRQQHAASVLGGPSQLHGVLGDALAQRLGLARWVRLGPLDDLLYASHCEVDACMNAKNLCADQMTKRVFVDTLATWPSATDICQSSGLGDRLRFRPFRLPLSALGMLCTLLYPRRAQFPISNPHAVSMTLTTRAQSSDATSEELSASARLCGSRSMMLR